MSHYAFPKISRLALLVWWRNLLVWRKLLGVSVVMNFGEPFI